MAISIAHRFAIPWLGAVVANEITHHYSYAGPCAARNRELPKAVSSFTFCDIQKTLRLDMLFLPYPTFAFCTIPPNLTITDSYQSGRLEKVY